MAKAAPANKTPMKIGSIDLTPTWRGLLPALVEPAARGNKQCLEELYRIADYADLMPKKVSALIEDLIRIDKSIELTSPLHRELMGALAKFAIPQTLEEFLKGHERSAPVGPDEPAKIYATLARIAPQIHLSAKAERDDSFKWDGDGPDPVTQGFQPFDVTVTASATVNGQKVEGEASLGGHYIETEERTAGTKTLGDIGGYLPQLLQGAVDELSKQCADASPVITEQAKAASQYLEEVMRARWQLQNPAEMTRETFEAALSEFTSLVAETHKQGEPYPAEAIARLDLLSTAMGAAPWLNHPQQGIVPKSPDKAPSKGRGR